MEIINKTADSDFTMTVEQSFQNILQEIQSSSLNFKIELCPFSAIVHLKKSYIIETNPVSP